ncbi:hypothetical protein ZEAMMB73_Zm00001d043360 [Zea mays]|uniref:Uncharacterized protein n=1 Tax=Zea mays TaxID=4577 RepID=A0A1D6NAX5_MAIZE|nr:hypothetical protein ZEAMMB73_Zm00001d043360 [Zea mays]
MSPLRSASPRLKLINALVVPAPDLGPGPDGSYTIYMKIVGDDNEELSCISFGFSISFVASEPGHERQPAHG